MNTTVDLLKQGRKEEVWDRYCGFIDLSLAEFMGVQKRLLVEQIDLLSSSLKRVLEEWKILKELTCTDGSCVWLTAFARAFARRTGTV